MTAAQARVAEAVRVTTALKGHFFPTPTFREVQREFDLLLAERRANIEARRQRETRGLLLVGASGAGKTTLVEAVLRQHTTDLRMLSKEQEQADVISMKVPSPATPKGVGLAMLEALGYHLRRDRSAHIIWQLIKSQFAARQVLFLHLDEAQDFGQHNNRSDQYAVISTLKSLMQSPEWPVGLILSGMPRLLDLVNMDTQLARRLKPVEVHPLKASVDGRMIVSALRQYAVAAQVAVEDSLYTPRFVTRLVHASDYCFGILAELICEAIGQMLMAGEGELSEKSFVACYARRSGCPEGLNPFIAENFRAINVRELLQPAPGLGDIRRRA
ncbi:TniB family NTP-binding protein [Pseudogemmobacter blasticus]|nr:TniB family NTP-binding protein [Fuscovulum blasticum]